MVLKIRKGLKKPSTILKHAVKLIKKGELKQIRGHLTDGQCGRCVNGIWEEYVMGSCHSGAYPILATRQALNLDKRIPMPDHTGQPTQRQDLAYSVAMLMNDGISISDDTLEKRFFTPEEIADYLARFDL